MATIRKRNGKWQAQVRVNNRKPGSRTFLTKSDALAWAREAEIACLNFNNSNNDAILAQTTVGDILARYGEEISPTKRSCPRELSIIRLVKKYPIYNEKLSLLTEGRAAYYRDTRLKVAKPATVVRELAVLSHAMEIARRMWDVPIKENAFSKLKKPKVNNQRSRRVEDCELENIIKAAKLHKFEYLACLISLALETAARRCELLGIKTEHVNFSKQTLYLPTTKNGFPRTIPLSPKAIQSIERFFSAFSRHGNILHLGDACIRYQWTVCLRDAHIDDLHFHDLRHEAISRFFEIGLTIPEVALISGHRDYKMLARYTHLKAENVAMKLALISER